MSETAIKKSACVSLNFCCDSSVRFGSKAAGRVGLRGQVVVSNFIVATADMEDVDDCLCQTLFAHQLVGIGQVLKRASVELYCWSTQVLARDQYGRRDESVAAHAARPDGAELHDGVFAGVPLAENGLGHGRSDRLRPADAQSTALLSGSHHRLRTGKRL